MAISIFLLRDIVYLSLEISIELFSFIFLFSGYFCSVDDCVVCIGFYGCNQSSSVLVYVVFEILYRCINSNWMLVHFKNGPEYLIRRTVQVFIPWMRFLLYNLVSSSFLFFQEYFFCFFFHLDFFDVRFQYSQVLVSFFISELFDFFSWFCSSIPSEIDRHVMRRFPWCNGYRRRKWTRQLEFKSSTRLIAFHIALIPLGKVWIRLFSLQLCVNSRADRVLQPWQGN